MKRLRSLLLVSLPLALVAATPSDPVGALRLKFPGSSDTIVSLPLQRPALVEAALAARSGNQLTLAADVPPLPTEGAYLLVMSGVLEGAVLPVTALSSRTLTVDAGSFDLSTVAANDLAAVVPYWTLDTLFPNGASMHVATNPLLLQSEVLMLDDTRAGTNFAAAAVYYYYNGAALQGSGWYRVGNTQAKAGNTTIPPQRYFIVRHDVAGDTELLLTGGVQMSGFRVPLATRAANQDQDNLVALPVPTSISLADSHLFESGAFQGSPSGLLITDQLMVFDNTVAGKNKAAAEIYYYYVGAAMQGAGWYKIGDTAHRADEKLLLAGSGVIVRKQRVAQPVSKIWSGIPLYLQ